MRVFAFASILSFGFASAAEGAPTRVVSLNLCTDELMLMLAAPDQILSVTHLAQRAPETSLWAVARRYRKNDGTLMSVAALRPDLVLTMGGGARDRLRIARRLGIRTIDLPFPQTLGDIEASIETVASALGRQREGAALIDRIRRLRLTAPRVQHETIWLGGGGRSVLPGSLAAQWMRLAGFRQRALTKDRVSLEQLLVHPPQILLRSDYRSGQYSGEQRWLSHPLAQRPRASRTIVTDGRPWTCMGPTMIAEVIRLRAAVAR